MPTASLSLRDAVLMILGLAIMLGSQIYLRPHRYDAGRAAVILMQERDQLAVPTIATSPSPKS